MVNDIPGNFKNKYRRTKGLKDNEDEGLACSYCGQGIMTQSHCLICPAWEALREGLDLTTIDGMVTFFRGLVEERKKK